METYVASGGVRVRTAAAMAPFAIEGRFLGSRTETQLHAGPASPAISLPSRWMARPSMISDYGAGHGH